MTSIRTSTDHTDRPEPSDITRVASALTTEGWLEADAWSAEPDQHYPPHAHRYGKAVVCVRGSIVFTTEETLLVLDAGDRAELDAGTVHEAVAGSEGAVCVEARGRR